MSASVEGASPLGPPSLLLCLFAALREYRVLGLLGDPELQHALRGDRDRLTGRGVAAHAGLAVDDDELADTGDGEAVPRFLVFEARLLAIVDSAPEAELSAGSDDDWGLGQVAAHALIVERGVTLIGLRLATGAEPGPTGQPRPAASATTRTGIAGLAARARATCDRLRAEFPGEPDAGRTARHPYFGDLNCFGWLLMLPTHYKGHLAALRAGRPSAL